MAKSIILLILFSLNAFSFSIVSDLDETIKVTGLGPRAIWNALTSKKIYLGMNTLLSELPEEKLFIVTASPRQIKKSIERLIDHHNLEVEELITRNYFSGESTFEYKYRSIQEILDKTSEKFVLIGDNTSQDEAVYRQIKKDYPQRVLAIYIRVTKSPEVKRDDVVTYFYHTIDIALGEFKARRATRGNVLNMLKDFAILRNKYDLVFPKFAYCPQAEIELLTPSVFGFSILVDQVNRQLVRHCRERKI